MQEEALEEGPQEVPAQGRLAPDLGQPMIRRTAIASIALVAVLGVAGCSNDSESDDDGAPVEVSKPVLPKPISAGSAASVPLGERLVREVAIPDGPDWLVSAFGSIWVKRDDGKVVRVDPANGEQLAEISPGPFVPPPCQGTGVTEDAVWACPKEGELIRIDPATNEIVATVPVDKSQNQGRLVKAAGLLWVLTDEGDTLTAIDPGQNAPSTTIALDSGCDDLAASGDTIWAACGLYDRVLRIDVAGGEITGQLELAGAGIAAVGEDLWVGFDGGLAQVDPESLAVDAVYDVHPRIGGSIFPAGDSVWVREENAHFLTRIDPAAQRIVETIEAPRLLSGGDVIVVGDSVWATAYEDEALVELRATSG
jgi:streptogramin lyase